MSDVSRSRSGRRGQIDGGPLHVLADRPAEVRFLFEQRERRAGGAAGASVLVHAVLGVLAFALAHYGPRPAASDSVPDRLPRDIVWLAEPGPGGGGGGSASPEPPRRAELPGRDPITVPVQKPPEVVPDPPQDEPPPEMDFTIPAQTMASAELVIPGVLDTTAPTLPVGGGGTGRGTGIGSGQGSGLGPGYGGGTGGGAYRPGSGVTLPRVIREVKPQYTADAMRAKVQGTVLLECIVQVDGTVSDVQIVRSLDPVFGLDQEAVKAARQWRFVPGTRFGQPVPVIVSIELSFTLR